MSNEISSDNISEYAENTSNEIFQDLSKNSIKTVTQSNSIKKPITTIKKATNTIKSERTAQKTAKATKKTAKSTKAILKATATSIKTTVVTTKSTILLLISGGWIVMLIIILICLTGIICNSCFSIFFAGQNHPSSSERSIQTAISEINSLYQDKIKDIKESNSYDNLELNEVEPNWKDVLAIYSVKSNFDNEQSSTIWIIDNNNFNLLSSIFFDMNIISHHTETNTIQLEDKEITELTLFIDCTSINANEISLSYAFSDEQIQMLNQLLDSDNDSLWDGVIG